MSSGNSTEQALLKHQLFQLLRKKQALVKDFGLARYRPHPKQDAFHRAGAKKRRGVFAGNRFGKSQLGCAEDCGWVYGERIWYPKSDPARFVGLPDRPVKGLVITTDWDKVEEIWTSEEGYRPGKVWQLLPSDFLKSKHKNHSGATESFVWQNGSMLRFDTVRSWLSNPQGSESSDWDFIHVDEPCPEGMFKAASRGLIDRNGSAWFTLTALTEPWIVDLFSPRDGKLSQEDFLDKGDYWMVRGAIWDNPYLSKEAIDLYASTLSDEEKECRLEGIPMAMAGLIYKEFKYEAHVLQQVPQAWGAYDRPPKEWPVYIAIDPHPQTPHAILAATVSPHQQIIFFDEVFVQCTIEALCSIIHDRFDRYNVVTVLCDPICYVNDPITGSNMDEEFARHGVFVEKATKALAQGILRAKSELRKQNRIYFSPHLSEALWEIQRYCWDTKNPDRKNKPVDKDDHMMENMYRLLLSDPCWVVREGKSAPVEDEVIDRADTELDDLSLLL